MYDPQNSLLVFKSNRNFGLLVLLSFAASELPVSVEWIIQMIEQAGLSIPHIGF